VRRSQLKPGKGFGPRRERMSPGKARLERAAFRRDASDNFAGLRSKPYRPLSTRKGLKDELDRVTSLLVRARDGRCVTCGTTESLQCSHYFKRSFLATRWNLQNCNAQCAAHNELHNRVPWPYREYMVKRIGEQGLDELFALRNSVWRPSDDELRALLGDLRQQLKKAA
jgi:hypothetical protein